MNSLHIHIAHPRLGSARWPAAQTPTANQLTREDDPLLGRPLIQAVRRASVPVSIGGFTPSRPAGFLMRILASGMLIGHRHAGWLWLRPLAPLPFMAEANQHNVPDMLGFARPFIPSSPSPKPRLRAERIGGSISIPFPLEAVAPADVLKPSPAWGPTRQFDLFGIRPVPDVIEHSDFPWESPRCFSATQKNSVLRVSGTLRNQFILSGKVKYLTSLNTMPRRHVPGTTSLALDIAVEAKQRFLALHGTLALKTKAETFEALVYSVSTKDILSPHAIERIERKLDYIIETLDGLA